MDSLGGKCLEDIYVGVDIEDISRFEHLDPQENKAFLDKIYTSKELEYCYSKAKSHQHLAARFAAKEAVIKIIGAVGGRISHKKIEIVNDRKGAPVVNILDDQYINIKTKISLSHSASHAIAFALGVKVRD